MFVAAASMPGGILLFAKKKRVLCESRARAWKDKEKELEETGKGCSALPGFPPLPHSLLIIQLFFRVRRKRCEKGVIGWVGGGRGIRGTSSFRSSSCAEPVGLWGDIKGKRERELEEESCVRCVREGKQSGRSE